LKRVGIPHVAVLTCDMLMSALTEQNQPTQVSSRAQ